MARILLNHLPGGLPRVAMLAVAILLGALASCNKTYYIVPALTATVPINDNSQSNCARSPVLSPASPVAPRVMHVKYIQNGKAIKEISVSSTAGKIVKFPSIYVPNSSVVTATCWASNSKGPGCEKSLPLTPAATTKAP